MILANYRSQSAREAADGVKPGVERTAKPQEPELTKDIKPAKRPQDVPSKISFVVLDVVCFQELDEFIPK